MPQLSLLLSRGKQIQTGAEWGTVVGFSVILLVVAVVGVLIALAVSRSRHARRRRGGRSRRRSSGRRPA
ncbi:MAG TPA: hypothetical protein VM914_08220 [Pyrinomonadaceae bacterium]|nr:hypothetical protein [Pyrinomonadaceae bacterium]